MIGLIFERRKTSLNPAFMNAEGVPVQTHGSGVYSMAVTAGYPSTIPAPHLAANSTADFSNKIETPLRR